MDLTDEGTSSVKQTTTPTFKKKSLSRNKSETGPKNHEGTEFWFQALRFAQQSKQLFEELKSSELPRALNACAYGGDESCCVFFCWSHKGIFKGKNMYN